MIDWIKNKLMRLAVSTSTVEQTLHTQNGFIEQTAIHADVNDGSMFKALLNGEMTREVEMIRAQMYAITERADTLSLNIVGYESEVDENGEIVRVPVFKPEKKSFVSALKRMKTDEFDKEFPLRYSVQNTDYGLDSYEGVLDHDARSNFKIEFGHYDLPKFTIEEHLQKLNVREINDSETILELYFNKYDDGYDVRRKVFTSELNSLFESGKKLNTLITFREVGFITDKNDKGTQPLRSFLYKEPEFLRQVEFNGFIVVKFKVKNVMIDFPIADKYRNAELDKLYEENASRSKEGF